jgi:phosphatidylserine/phosphatidylglycerophosphate/cardiolipin synthase-like enzyme
LEKAYVGSGELRYNSFNKNFELGVIINNTKIVKELRYIFEILFSRSQQLR